MDPIALPGEEATEMATVSAVQLRLPPFWSKNPRVWFRQIEAQFQLQRIFSQTAMYRHVVASIPSELADTVDDVLDNPPVENAYDYLKKIILQRTMESQSSCLQQLLNAEELGDRRPTQLLHRMRQLLGANPTEAHSNLLRELFIQRLPANVRMISASAASMTLDNLAELADRIVEHSAPMVSPVAGPTTPTSGTSIEAKLQALTEAVHALHLQSPARQSSRRRSSSRRHSPSATRSTRRRRGSSSDSSASPDRDHCWYHRRFGGRATRCTRPCTWQGNEPASH